MPHINKLIDFTVGAFIVYDNKVLLVDHKKLKKWLPVGGHIELDQNPDQALLNEISEETGLEVEIVSEKNPNPVIDRNGLWRPEFVDIHRIDDVHQHIGMYYFARAKSDKAILAEREHNAIRWFSSEELSDPQYKITEGVQFYAKAALDKLRN